MSDAPIPLLTPEAQIKRRLRQHFKDLGFRIRGGKLVRPPDSKDAIRQLHSHQRAARLLKESHFIESRWKRGECYFANGNEINPEQISPRLEVVKSESWQSDLFRLASLTWSIPVSQGYGRRIRFLVWDDHNEKLIGLIALGDPVFNLRSRDSAIGWTGRDRSERLACVLDAYVLGAIPPYNQLLCGKLLACLIRSEEVVSHFARKYGATRGLISGSTKGASLALVTTTSALGRSSLYNRLKINGGTVFAPVGYTAGWGHFHIPDDLFLDIRKHLVSKGDTYASNHEFGDGPNWRLRAIRKGLTHLGFDPAMLKHGVGRQVFLCPIASNAIPFLRGDEPTPLYDEIQTVAHISTTVKERWIVPRSLRQNEYRDWNREMTLSLLKYRPMLPNPIATAIAA